MTLFGYVARRTQDGSWTRVDDGILEASVETLADVSIVESAAHVDVWVAGAPDSILYRRFAADPSTTPPMVFLPVALRGAN